MNSGSIKYKIGQQVVVTTKEFQEKKGTIRFIGKLQNKNDQYFGVELDQACGKNNGDFEGKLYFKVQKKIEKGLFGVFVKIGLIKPFENKKGPGNNAPKTGKNPAPPTAASKNKLSNELIQQQNNEIQGIKQQLEKAYERIREFQELDAVKQVESMKSRIKQYQQLVRDLKLQIEQVRYKTDDNQAQKLKTFAQSLELFKNQKEAAERQKNQLKKKVQRLEAQLEQGADKQEMLEKLTFKNQNLQSKNEKLKSELQAANTQLKNFHMLGGGGGSGKGNQELQQNITTLNQMIALLQSDLNEQKEKSARFQAQIQSNAARLNDLVKLQRKLRSRDQELQNLKAQLEVSADAAGFAEKLTLDLLAKEDTLKEQNKRCKQFAERVAKLQGQLTQSHDMVSMQTLQLQNFEEQIQKVLDQKAQKQKQISMLNDQIAKYKQKIKELSDNNSSLLMTMEEKEDQTPFSNYINTDIYQHKYYQLSKLLQITQHNYLQYQLNMASIRQYAGIFLSNVYDTLPQNFSLRLHPSILNLLQKIAATNHKMYMLFEVCSSALTHKSQLYTAQQQDLAGSLIMLLVQIPELYSSLSKIQFALISADCEEDIAEILSHPELKDVVTRIDIFTQQLLHKVLTETIDAQVNLDPYIQPIDLLDQLALSIKRLPTQLATRHELAVQTMKGVHQILASIQLYRKNSEARQTAQVDILIQNFLKMLESYLRQCCTNPHIRLKNDMKNYLGGVDLIVKLLRQIELDDNLQQLNSLYSQTEDIKMLKDTVMTTQFHLKQLIADLDQITYPSPLSRIHIKLPGRIWQERLKIMRDELVKFQSTLKEKEQLQHVNSEQKLKILVLQKEIKDRQTTKELHQRRIGQLQLKVQQSAFLQSDFKRQTQKLRSLEEAAKILEDQLSAQNKRKKQLEEELRKTKEKFDIFQTETIVKQKKAKNSANLSSDDISNLAIFKSVVAEAGALRNHTTKQKLQQLKFSPIFSQQKQQIQSTNRRQILNSFVDATIGQNINYFGQLQSEAFEQKNEQLQTLNIGRLTIRDLNKAEICVDLNKNMLVKC